MALWTGSSKGQAEQKYDYMALGNHGQFIYISPPKNLIILRFGKSYGEYGGAQGGVDLFYAFASNFDE